MNLAAALLALVMAVGAALALSICAVLVIGCWKYCILPMLRGEEWKQSD